MTPVTIPVQQDLFNLLSAEQEIVSGSTHDTLVNALETDSGKVIYVFEVLFILDNNDSSGHGGSMYVYDDEDSLIGQYQPVCPPNWAFNLVFGFTVPFKLPAGYSLQFQASNAAQRVAWTIRYIEIDA
jgi:hypothetical protein